MWELGVPDRTRKVSAQYLRTVMFICESGRRSEGGRGELTNVPGIMNCWYAALIPH